MGNPYFRFKQFTVFHNLCAMKVGIDGVLLGAWAEVENAKRILDIGSGSGLIALMLAQRNCNATIEAIDIEASAIEQTKFNIENSPWKKRMSARNISLQNFAATTQEKYDLIVSNPPFFVDSLKTPAPERTNARHTDSLTHEELIVLSQSLLTQNGRLCIILPAKEGKSSKDFAEKAGLFCTKMASVFPKPNTEAKRLLLEFSLKKDKTEISALTIETEIRHQYTPEFTRLAKDFYLKL